MNYSKQLTQITRSFQQLFIKTHRLNNEPFVIFIRDSLIARITAIRQMMKGLKPHSDMWLSPEELLSQMQRVT